jgi:type VI secretion system protein
MRLILEIVGENAGLLGRDAQKAFAAEGGSLGRSGTCDWQLPDPTNTLSARHATIAFNGLGFTITDTSTNGVYINTVDAPLGRGNTAPLTDGDTLYLSDYIISVAIEHEAIEDRQRLGVTSNAMRIGGSRTPSQGAGSGDPLLAGLPGGDAAVPADPLAAIGGPLPADRSFVPSSPAAGTGAAQPPRDPLLMFDDRPQNAAPAVLDDLGLVNRARPIPAAGPAPVRRPVTPPAPPPAAPHQQQPDLQRALEQLAFIARPDEAPQRASVAPIGSQSVTPPAVPPAAPAAPHAAIIPDDLSFSDLIPGAAPAGPAPALGAPSPLGPADRPHAAIPPLQQPFPPAPPVPPAPPARKPLSPGLANDFVALRDPGAAVAAMPQLGERVIDPLAVLKQRAAERGGNNPQRDELPVRPAAAASASGAAPLPGGGGDDHRIFWQALGLDPASIPAERRQEALVELGLALREMATGLHSVLAARAMVKSEFQIEQTRIQSGDNNAFKFFKSGQDALRKALAREPGYLPLPHAVREGFHDIKAHEVAAMVAIGAAIRNLLAQLSPQALGTESTNTGLFGGDNKGKLWDRFVERHASMADDVDRTVRALLSEEFTRSYDAHIAMLKNGAGRPT